MAVRTLAAVCVWCLCLVAVRAQGPTVEVQLAGHTTGVWRGEFEYQSAASNKSVQCTGYDTDCCEDNIYDGKTSKCSFEAVVVFGGRSLDEQGSLFTNEVRILGRNDGSCSRQPSSPMSWRKVQVKSVEEKTGRNIALTESATSAVPSPRSGHTMTPVPGYLWPKSREELDQELQWGVECSRKVFVDPARFCVWDQGDPNSDLQIFISTHNVNYAGKKIPVCVKRQDSMKDIRMKFERTLSPQSETEQLQIPYCFHHETLPDSCLEDDFSLAWYKLDRPDTLLHAQKTSSRITSFAVFGGYSGSAAFNDLYFLHVHPPAKFHAVADSYTAFPFAAIPNGDAAALSDWASKTVADAAFDVRWEKPSLPGTAAPLPRHQHVALQLGPLLVIHGGHNLDQGFLSDLWLLDLRLIFRPGSDHVTRARGDPRNWDYGWVRAEPAGSPPPALAGHAASLQTMSDGQVYIVIFGGRGEAGLSADVYVLRTNCIQNHRLQGSQDGRITCGIYPNANYAEKDVKDEDRSVEEMERDRFPKIQLTWMRVQATGPVPGPRLGHIGFRSETKDLDTAHFMLGWGLDERGGTSRYDERYGFLIPVQKGDYANSYRGDDWYGRALHEAVANRRQPALLSGELWRFTCTAVVNASKKPSHREVLQNPWARKALYCLWKKTRDTQVTPRKFSSVALFSDGRVNVLGGYGIEFKQRYDATFTDRVWRLDRRRWLVPESLDKPPKPQALLRTDVPKFDMVQ